MARLEIKLKEMELRVETREGEERKVDHQMCRCEHFMTLKMMIAMMIQVRAEVSEKLDGLVESVADLRSQFEGTLARVCPHSTMVMAMLTCDFLQTLI